MADTMQGCEAPRRARREIEASCGQFIGECVGEMLASIDARGDVHHKALNRLPRFGTSPDGTSATTG